MCALRQPGMPYVMPPTTLPPHPTPPLQSIVQLKNRPDLLRLLMTVGSDST